MTLHWSAARFALTHPRQLVIPQLSLSSGQCWAFVGANGSGKTALARALCGELPLLSGEAPSVSAALRLSFEQQQALLEQDWQRRNTDMLADGEEAGLLAGELLPAAAQTPAGQRLLAELGLQPLLTRPFRVLSSGEGRKLLLAGALLQAPDWLVLDEPFDGLDVQARRELTERLQALHAQGQGLVLILNRFDEIPPCATHLGLLGDSQLLRVGARAEVLASPEVQQWQALEHQAPGPLPPPVQAADVAGLPLVRLRQLTICYDERKVIDGLDWELLPGQHWQITGPNGAGKSTLLSVLTGDHPQGYSNDVTLFGRRRGSGESIWDIKRHIGLVSPALHLEYRVATTPEAVILSGFFDSIGLYQTPGDQELALARRWLALLGLSGQAKQPFHSLSFGQQRLLLIARALVKHPPLLILDEPLQGLDAINRHLVRHWVGRLMAAGSSQLLFVSHHAEDAPAGITHRLSFEPDGQGGYGYRQQALNAAAVQ
ncbi:molybdate ABC transporter ATP-binding protein ModF [Pseudaeromonas sp. ZJS20]|uniref:molybdate ABC transporter ATP-binding protein ModF n=1 Tax=Pseudaeromonas aegiceratis TaxID=3153928 RepID=UPI00390CB5B3